MFGIMSRCVIYPGMGIGASRKFWIKNRGPLEPGVCVLHRCDHNTAEDVCINLNHLFLGTQQDNIRDAVSKGRLHGGRSPNQRKVPYLALSPKMRAIFDAHK